MFIQLCFGIWINWFSGERKSVTNFEENDLLGVTILICAHNELENLKENLKEVLSQAHPQFQVLVINDRSTDGSDLFLNELKKVNHQLSVIHIDDSSPRQYQGKKDALFNALNHISHDIVLFTDADCKPSSNQWVTLMTRHFINENINAVLGYGAFLKTKNWINYFVRWETLHTFLLFSTFANTKLAYMGVGRNLACRSSNLKLVFNESRWNQTPSGDDDLLINSISRNAPKSIIVEGDMQSYTYSNSPQEFKTWLSQKQRHISVGKYYNVVPKFLLGVYGLSHALVWVLFFVLLFMGYGYLCNGMMILRCMLYWGLYWNQSLKNKENELTVFLPLFDFGWMFYNVILSPYIFLKNKKTWK
jgi:glycosyltransferase involved in cell wall biosynthesis